MGTSGWVLLFVIAFGASGCGCGGDDDPSDDAGTDAGADASADCTTDDDCDDGLFCNGMETCDPSGCTAGTAPSCDDSMECTADSCSEEERTCVNRGPDADGDGHATDACGGDDCDDANPDRYPGAPEVCDEAGADEDCDPTSLGSRDADRDRVDDARCCNPDGSGGMNCGEDCDDLRRGVHPGATEACDRYDNDCDGNVDEEVAASGFVDDDRDGGGSDAPRMACFGAVGFALSEDDCDDADETRHRGQLEICDGLDNDCDGTADEGAVPVVWFRDADGDGFGSAASGTMSSCAPIPGYSLLASDCDDGAAGVSPGATEACNGRDDDCNGLADHEIGTNDFEDDDGDGAVDAACAGGTDCDDRDAATNPGAGEICDGRDNDCDTRLDEGAAPRDWYFDADGDGFGEMVDSMSSCVPPAGYAPLSGDCDDGDSGVNPRAVETCNFRDDDCDGDVDDPIDVATDPRHCGACGRECPTGELCSARMCSGAAPGTDAGPPRPDAGPLDAGPPDTGPYPDVACAAGTADCNRDFLDGCETLTEADPDNCGMCGRRCPAPMNGLGVCAAGACMGFRCLAGYSAIAGTCQRTPPRQLRPISGSYATRGRTTFGWQLAAGQDGAEVQICSNRACSAGTVIATLDATGGGAIPTTALPPGTVWWRVRGKIGAMVVTTYSPTWQVVIPSRDASDASTAHGAILDVNGDGFADVAAAGEANDVYVWHGSAAGLPAMPTRALTRPPGSDGLGLFLAPAGDVNGDGFPDFAAGMHFGLAIWLGGAAGLPLAASQVLGPIGGNANRPVAAGDVDGDGYGDLALLPWADGSAADTSASILRGGPAGVSATGMPLDPPPMTQYNRNLGAGDVNGDGLSDVVVFHDNASALYLGRTTGITRTPTVFAVTPWGAGSRRAGDVIRDGNGDGRADVFYGNPSGFAVAFIPGTSDGLGAPVVYNAVLPYSEWGFDIESLGDVNGDGLGDVAAISIAPSGRSSDMRIFFGHAGTGNTTLDATLVHPSGGGWQQYTGAGDVDGDGYEEMVAALGGSVRIWAGTAGGLGASTALAAGTATLGNRGVH